MWEIKTIIYTTVLLPFFFRKEKSKIANAISYLLIFFLWAFQYKMSIDWQVYINRWIHVTKGVVTEDRELEFVYYTIMKICEPISFYGYLIVCAAFSVSVIYLYGKKYIEKDFVWLFFLSFSLNTSLLLDFINTNRQSLAIMFVLISVYVMANKARLLWKDPYFIVSFLAIFLAINIHTSAIVAIPCLLFPFLITKIKDSNYLYVFLVIDILSFFVNFSDIEKYAFTTMADNEEISSFAHYTTEIAKRSKSYYEQGLYMILIIVSVHFFDHFKKEEKPIILAALFFLSLQGYAMYTMLRALSYYRIFVPFAIPILLFRIRPLLTPVQKEISYGLVLFYSAYQFYRFSVDVGGPNYVGYKNFQTLLDAPFWM